MKPKPAEIVISLTVLALGIAVAVGTTALPSAGGYARVGPNVAPAAVAAGLILLGVVLLYQAVRGGWPNAVPDDPVARGEHPFHVAAFLWISTGLIAQLLLIHRAGFVLAQAALLACVARGFGSRRPARDLGIGIAMGLAIFFFFVKFLNVNLPAGWLRAILGSAGI